MTGKVVAQDPWPRGEGVIPQGQEKSPKGRGSYLPRELRIRLFDEVIGLRNRGLSYREIVDEIYRKHGIKLSKSHISFWVRGLNSPYNRGYIPSVGFLKASEELAYMIGVVLGDGYATKGRTIKNYNNVKVGLKVKDREFAVEFARCLAMVLGRPPKKPRYGKDAIYVVEVGSETLYQILKKPVDLDRLRQYIEHCGKCMAAFLRGFFDSEGSVDERGCLTLSNTDLKLLEYVKHLLQHLGIETTGPRLKTRRGTVMHNPRTGKKYLARKDLYLIYIRASSNRRFYEKVGFSIRRKQKRLEDYLRRRPSQTPSPHFSPP